MFDYYFFLGVDDEFWDEEEGVEAQDKYSSLLTSSSNSSSSSQQKKLHFKVYNFEIFSIFLNSFFLLGIRGG